MVINRGIGFTDITQLRKGIEIDSIGFIDQFGTVEPIEARMVTVDRQYPTGRSRRLTDSGGQYQRSSAEPDQRPRCIGQSGNRGLFRRAVDRPATALDRTGIEIRHRFTGAS